MTRFRHKCAQRGCWLEERWDSDSVGRAAEEADGKWPFPRGISPTDVDGLIECSGKALLIETKTAGAPESVGQRRALTSLSRLGITILLQECAPPKDDAVVRVRFCYAGEWHGWIECDRLHRDRLIQRWFTKVAGEREVA